MYTGASFLCCFSFSFLISDYHTRLPQVTGVAIRRGVRFKVLGRGRTDGVKGYASVSDGDETGVDLSIIIMVAFLSRLSCFGWSRIRRDGTGWQSRLFLELR